MTTFSVILIISGLFFFTTGTIGMLRFPDFYTRIHSASKCDTLGVFLLLAGVSVYNIADGLTLSSLLVSIKIMLIAFFIFVANPTACHAITKAAFEAGVMPWKKPEDNK